MKGLLRSLSRNKTRQPIAKETFVAKNLLITLAGATGVGYGSVVIGDFPEGNIQVMGCVALLKFSKSTAAGVVDTFDGDFSIGTTPTADATLNGTEVNIVPSTALGAATSGVSPLVRGASTTFGTIYDNTDGSLELNLNLLIDDANISADGQILAANGIVCISYIVYGDD